MSAEMIWKIAKFAIPVIIGAIIGGFVVGKVKQIQMDALKVELAKKHQELTVCQDANATSQATIGNLTMELRSAQQSCMTRLRQKERTAAEIKRIDSLKPGVIANETSSTVVDSSDDPVCDALNGMFINGARNPAGSQN